jgi:glycosyltransferase involved in cell wall biosynthesis
MRNTDIAPTERIPVVMHVLTSLHFGGVERHMEVIAGVLVHARLQHIFVALGRGGAVETRLRGLGADVRCLGQKTGIPSLGALKALLKLFWQERPLAVHTHGAEANFHGLLAAWLTGVPVRIGEEIGIPSHGKKARLVFRLIYGTAHRVVGISQSVTDWLVTSREVSRSKAKRIYNPVQLSPLHQQPVASQDVFRIGFVGRLEAVKNPLALLDAFVEFQAGGAPCELWIVGDGSERAELEQRISKMGLAGKVRLFGYQSEPDSFIRQCHVYVQPSLSEGFGLALVEAMGCGVPVIATAVGGAPEIIEHGRTGWLLPQASPDLIVLALKEARRMGPGKLHEMGQRARESVQGRFEPVHYLGEIEALYQQLAAGRGAESLNG